MTSRTLTESYDCVATAHAPAASAHSLRRRLPALIFALLALLGGAFSWMAYREVHQALYLNGTERLTAACSQLAELLAQSTAGRLNDTRRLAGDPLMHQALAANPAELEAAVPPSVQAFIARNSLATAWLYDGSGRLIGRLSAGKEARAAPEVTAPSTVSPEGVSPLRSQGNRVWYSTTAPIPSSADASPAGSLTIQRSLGSSQAVGLIERLIGSGAVLKVGNASGDLWTDLSAPVEAPPSVPPGTSATYTAKNGERRVGTAVAIAGTPWLVWVEVSERSILGPAATLLRRMVPITFVLTLLGALLVYAVSRRITKPLEQFAHAAEAIAGGDYSRRVTVSRRDEIGRLATAFNVMADRVAESHDELDGRVRARTIELEYAREALLQQAADLSSANRELEAFSYSVSHDLRSPLRSIDGFAQALAEDYEEKLDETGRNFLSRIRAAAQRMGMLIDDLLSLSRVSRHELQRTDLNLTALAREIADRLQETDPGRDVKWEIASGLAARGDARLIRIVLENLLANAWKFTSKRPAATIEFTSMDVPDRGRAFVVRDNGAGFDTAHAGKLFGAFQRLHDVTQFPGTGIGLATVQRVLHRHGGRIWAEAAVNRGASFFFTLESGHTCESERS
jgi:signal transduction histidine kinase